MSRNREPDFGPQVLILLFALLLAIVLSITLDNDHNGIEERLRRAGVEDGAAKPHLNSDAATHRDPK